MFSEEPINFDMVYEESKYRFSIDKHNVGYSFFQLSVQIVFKILSECYS